MQTKQEGDYVVVRTKRAGCFAGVLLADDGNSATLGDCRRLWYWKGAASLSQMAVTGTSAPEECKFSVPVSEHTVRGVVEVLKATAEARRNIKEVPEWTA